MPDISHTIIAKSDQLNAGDLAQPVTVTVRSVRVTRDEQPVIVDIGDELKPWKPCKGMRRLLAQVWGTNTDTWPGGRVTLFRDASATWAGEAVGGIRVSAISGIDKPMRYVMRTSKKGTTTYDVGVLAAAPKVDPSGARAKLIEAARDKYGTDEATVRAWLAEQGGPDLDAMTVDDLRGLFRALPDIAAWASEQGDGADDGGKYVE